jgi:isopropylmalate/homocitrate/citramalate synthase
LSVTVCDVGPRDGLQDEAATLPPPARAELVPQTSEPVGFHGHNTRNTGHAAASGALHGYQHRAGRWP